MAVTMNVSATATDMDFPDGPVNATVLLNDTVLYSFNGTGTGGLGKQDCFGDGNQTAAVEFGIGGGMGSTTVRLPKTAVVQNASMDVAGSGPERLVDLWNFSGQPFENTWNGARAGDVNNDGYDDIVVGASSNDVKGTDAGAAYLFYGSSTPDNTPDVVFYGNASGDTFGYPVSGVGDLNGDGYDDIAISAYMDDTGGPNSGAVYVYFGGDLMDNVSDLVIIGDRQDQWFGCWIAGACDVNGDGYNDLVLTSNPDWDAGRQQYGVVSIYYGGINMDSTPDVIITAPEKDVYFNVLPTETPDLNGDGYDDVVVGAGLSADGGIQYGKAYVYFGGKSMDNVSDLVLTGPTADGFFGIFLSSAGDLNGDGYDDLIVDDDEVFTTPIGTGKAYIYYGGQNMDNLVDLILSGTGAGDSFGIGVCAAGDLNKDGFGDVVAGAPRNGTNGPNSGACYIYYGGQNMDNASDYTMYGSNGDWFGDGSDYAGDINKDGYYDFIVNVGGNSTLGISSVRVYSIVMGLLSPSVDIGSQQVWEKERYFNGTGTTADFTEILTAYLENTSVSLYDEYGNSFVDVPINITTQCDGNMSLSDLSIVYSYTTSTLEFSDALNVYVTTHKGDQDSSGNITVPIKVVSETLGRLKLTNLTIVLDNAPELSNGIPDTVMDEDSIASDLVDLQQYFNDDYDQAGQLNYQVVSFSNDTIVNVSITGNRYLSVDALTGSQNDNWTGTVDVIVKCSDRWNSTTVSNQFRVTVQNVPDPPAFISQPPTNATAGIEYQYQVMAVDGDNDPLSYVLVDKPLDMRMNPQTGLVNWIPHMGGDYLISVLVSDGHFNVYQNFSINVPNQAPKINSMANVTAIKGVPYEYLVNATDADRDMLAFSLVSDVPGMTIDAQKGNLSWTPESTGDFTIKIMVADGKGGMAVQEFLVHVYEKIEPKMDFVTLPEQAVVDGKVAVSGRIIKGSVDVVSIQYRLDSGEWVNVTGNESWEINMDTTKMKNGNHTLQIRAYDGLTYSEIARRSFTVKNPVKEAETPNTPYVIGAIVLIAIFAGALLLVRKKRPPDEEK
jgi:hypothetical protein